MTDPDTIRANIERTRSQLGGDVDALADKVNPSNIADRQKEKVKDRVRSARESVMGATQSAKDALPGDGSAASAKGAAVGAAKGHPMVVGLIAFGAGWLLSSLIPTAAAEKDLAATAKDAAKETAQSLKEPAQDAAAHLKDTAQEAAGTVKQEGQSAAADVRGTATDAKDDVAGAAKGA